MAVQEWRVHMGTSVFNSLEVGACNSTQSIQDKDDDVMSVFLYWDLLRVNTVQITT